MKEFVALAYDKQWSVLKNVGSQVAKRLDKEYTISLYKIDGFFVEVFFSRLRLEISHLRGLLPAELPVAYLATIAEPKELKKKAIILYQ